MCIFTASLTDFKTVIDGRPDRSGELLETPNINSFAQIMAFCSRNFEWVQRCSKLRTWNTTPNISWEVNMEPTWINHRFGPGFWFKEWQEIHLGAQLCLRRLAPPSTSFGDLGGFDVSSGSGRFWVPKGWSTAKAGSNLDAKLRTSGNQNHFDLRWVAYEYFLTMVTLLQFE